MRLNEERRRLLEQEDYAQEEAFKVAFERLRQEAEKTQALLHKARAIVGADDARKNPQPWPIQYEAEKDRLKLAEQRRRDEAMADYDRKNPKPSAGPLGLFKWRVDRWEKARDENRLREEKRSQSVLDGFEKGKEKERQANRKKAEKRFHDQGHAENQVMGARNFLEKHGHKSNLERHELEPLRVKPEAVQRASHNMSRTDAKCHFLTERLRRTLYMENLEGRVRDLEDFTSREGVAPKRQPARAYNDRDALTLEHARIQEELRKEMVDEIKQTYPDLEEAMAYYREQKAVLVDPIQGLRNHKENDNRTDPCAIAEGLECLRHQRAAMTAEENQKYGRKDEEIEFQLRYGLESREARIDSARETYERKGNKISDAQQVMESQFEKDRFEAEFGRKLWERVAEREEAMFGKTATYLEASVKRDACKDALEKLTSRKEEIQRGEGIPEDIYTPNYSPSGGPTVRANGFRADEKSAFTERYDYDDKKEERYGFFAIRQRGIEMIAEGDENEQDRRHEGPEQGDDDEEPDEEPDDDPETRPRR